MIGLPVAVLHPWYTRPLAISGYCPYWLYRVFVIIFSYGNGIIVSIILMSTSELKLKNCPLR